MRSLGRCFCRVTLALACLGAAPGLGCGDGRGQAQSGGTGDGVGDGDTGSDTDAGDASSGPVLDVGGGMESADDGGTADECTNVDILFVIDNSGSMADNQESVVASFGGFIAAIEQNLALAESYHIGVISSEAYYENAPGCTAIGDLVTQTGGVESSNCVGTPFASGKRYLDQTEPDLEAKFACIAELGATGSDDEKVAASMIAALAPANNEAGQCNDGFARLDSLLVVVIITDEDDAPEPYGCDPDAFPGDPDACDTTGSGGTPDEWTQTILSYKANLPENVVVLALIGGYQNSCGAVISSKLLGFANNFGDHGFVGDVCAASYDEFFAQALPVVDMACEDYVPPEG
jgi:hypothetical protein